MTKFNCLMLFVCVFSSCKLLYSIDTCMYTVIWDKEQKFHSSSKDSDLNIDEKKLIQHIKGISSNQYFIVYKGPKELDPTFVFPYEIMLYEDLTPYPRFVALNNQNNSIKENGYRYPYIDSLPDGNWFLYYKIDTINAICMFKKTIKNFVVDGELIYYFENGATLSKDKYVKGLITDTSYWSFDMDSNVYTLILFETRNGVSCIDKRIEYHKDKNNITYIRSYYDSKLECNLYFYETKQLKEFYKIQNHKKNGMAYFFDENGVLLKSETYKNGVLQNKK